MLLSQDLIARLADASEVAQDYIDISPADCGDGDVCVTLEVDRTPSGEWVARTSNRYQRYVRQDGSVYRYCEDTTDHVPADFSPLFGELPPRVEGERVYIYAY